MGARAQPSMVRRRPAMDGVSLVDLMQGKRSGIDLEAYSDVKGSARRRGLRPR